MPKYLITVMAFLITGVLVMVLVLPSYQELNLTEAQIEEKNTDLLYQDERIAELRGLSDQLKDHQESLDKITMALPDDPSLPSLLRDLEAQASKSGLVLRNIGLASVSKESLNAKVKNIEVDIFLVGSYSALKEFLQNLENSARLLDVKKISFSRPQAGGAFTFNLLIQAHSY